MSDYEKLVSELREIVSELDKTIKSKSEYVHVGVYQAVSNEAYCSALAKVKQDVENVLLGKR